MAQHHWLATAAASTFTTMASVSGPTALGSSSCSKICDLWWNYISGGRSVWLARKIPFPTLFWTWSHGNLSKWFRKKKSKTVCTRRKSMYSFLNVEGFFSPRGWKLLNNSNLQQVIEIKWMRKERVTKTKHNPPPQNSPNLFFRSSIFFLNESQNFEKFICLCFFVLLICLAFSHLLQLLGMTFTFYNYSFR